MLNVLLSSKLFAPPNAFLIKWVPGLSSTKAQAPSASSRRLDLPSTATVPTDVGTSLGRSDLGIEPLRPER